MHLNPIVATRGRTTLGLEWKGFLTMNGRTLQPSFFWMKAPQFGQCFPMDSISLRVAGSVESSPDVGKIAPTHTSSCAFRY
jgi:hypothetical protein